MAKFLKAILGVLIGLFLASVLAAIFVDIYCYVRLPNAPDEKAERTNRMVVSHGSVRYGSAGELQALRAVQGLLPIGVVLLLGGGVLGLRWGIFHIGPTGRVKPEQPGQRAP